MKKKDSTALKENQQQPFTILRDQRQKQTNIVQTRIAFAVIQEPDDSQQLEDILPQPLSYGFLGWEEPFRIPYDVLLGKEVSSCMVPSPNGETLIDYQQFD